MNQDYDEVFSITPMPHEHKEKTASPNYIPILGVGGSIEEETAQDTPKGRRTVQDLMQEAVNNSEEYEPSSEALKRVGRSPSELKPRPDRNTPKQESEDMEDPNDFENIDLGEEFDDELADDLEELRKDTQGLDDGDGEIDFSESLLSEDSSSTASDADISNLDPKEILKKRQKAKEQSRAPVRRSRKPVDKLSMITHGAGKDEDYSETQVDYEPSQAITWMPIPASSLLSCLLGTLFDSELRKSGFLKQGEIFIEDRNLLFVESEEGSREMTYISENVFGGDLIFARGKDKQAARIPLNLGDFLLPLGEELSMFLEDELEGVS